jgi:hypothetical protein
MVMIDVDFDVFKQLTLKRRTEAMTENEVIRELLGLEKKTTSPTNETSTPWVSKGVSFPHGTEFRATYKGQQYSGTVKDGALVVGGKSYSSPSAAAVAITKNAVNGWEFWECLFPGTIRWKKIFEYRK